MKEADNSTKSATSHAKSILVVDDTASVADLMREMLQSFGHRAELCTTVEEAMVTYAPSKFDLVITDYTMPGMSGVEFARRVRSSSPGQPILLITGSSYSIAEGEAKKFPVDGVLQKPFSVLEFQNAVNALLKKANSSSADGAAQP